MKRDFNQKQIAYLLLKDLYESSNGLYPFTFYNRYKISTKDLVNFIRKYKEKGFLNYEDEKIELSEVGRTTVYSIIFHSRSKRGLDSNLPEGYKGNKIDKDIPYIPIISYLSPEFKHRR